MSISVSVMLNALDTRQRALIFLSGGCLLTFERHQALFASANPKNFSYGLAVPKIESM